MEDCEGDMKARALHILGIAYAERSRRERDALAREALLNTAIGHLQT